QTMPSGELALKGFCVALAFGQPFDRTGKRAARLGGERFDELLDERAYYYLSLHPGRRRVPFSSCQIQTCVSLSWPGDQKESPSSQSLPRCGLSRPKK